MPFNNTYLSRNNRKHLQNPGGSSGRQRPRATHASSNEVSSRLAPCHSSNGADIRLRSSCHLHYEARLGQLPTLSSASSIMHDLWPPFFWEKLFVAENLNMSNGAGTKIVWARCRDHKATGKKKGKKKKRSDIIVRPSPPNMDKIKVLCCHKFVSVFVFTVFHPGKLFNTFTHFLATDESFFFFFGTNSFPLFVPCILKWMSHILQKDTTTGDTEQWKAIKDTAVINTETSIKQIPKRFVPFPTTRGCHRF